MRHEFAIGVLSLALAFAGAAQAQDGGCCGAQDKKPAQQIGQDGCGEKKPGECGEKKPAQQIGQDGCGEKKPGECGEKKPAQQVGQDGCGEKKPGECGEKQPSECGEAKAKDCGTGSCCETGQTAASPGFDRVKALVGCWASADEDGDGKPDVRIQYRATSNGSAVVETILPGTPSEMITVYYRDGERLMLTHFCHMGSQPRLRSTDAGLGKVVRYEFVDGVGCDPKQGFMGRLEVTFLDSDTIQHKWTVLVDGKAAKEIAFELKRVPEAKPTK